MGFSVTKAISRLQDETEMQRTPKPITVGQYGDMVLKGIKRLYVDTGRALAYDEKNYSYDDGTGDFMFGDDLPIDEEEYVMLCAMLNFYKRVMTDVNNIVSYSTDAISVTGADKPYAHLKDTVDDLERRRRELYYRMPRYTMDYVIDD